MAIPSRVASTLSAANTFTDAIGMRGSFNFSISGTFVGIITIQRAFKDPETKVWSAWFDVSSYTTEYEDIGILPESENLLWRAGFKAGEYTSGSALVRISK